VCERLGRAHPFESSHAAYVLVEAAGAADPSEELATVVGGLDDVVDVAVASEAGRRRALWRYREGHTEAINTLGAPHKLDVGLPIHALESFLAEVGSRVARAAPGARVWLFGHAAEGNVHVNVTGVDPDDESVSDAVLTFAAELGGSISAEHGIGAAKRRFVHLTRSAAEIEVMRAIKRALDPRDTLNPHVLLP
jgi:FAD/FMN-containing dehydrogenase